MSTLISHINPVSFTIGSFNVSGQNFQTPLILGTNTIQWERTQAFTSLAGMVTAGYSTTDDEYIAASDMLSQTSKGGKKVTSFKVGRKFIAETTDFDVTFDSDGTAGTFTISLIARTDGVETTYTTGTIAYDDDGTAAKAALEALAPITTVTVTLNGANISKSVGFNVTVDAVASTAEIKCSAVDVDSLTSVSTSTISHNAYGSSLETFTEGFNNIVAYDTDWYQLIPVTVTEADILLLAAAVEAYTESKKVAFYTTRDAAVKQSGSSDVASDLNSSSYTRSCITYSEDTSHFAGACWAGAVIPDKIHAINPCYYPLAAITGDTLTAAEIGYIVGKKCNRIETIGGYTVIPGTSSGESGDVGGIVSSGQYLDFIVAKDYLEARVSEALYSLLLNNKKIPFTKAGLSLVESTIISTVTTYGVNENIVEAGSIVVTMPDLDTYSTTKKAARWLDDIVGDGDAQGAINKISVSFNLTV